jgi:nucleoside-diphosphate-sugar epimerase
LLDLTGARTELGRALIATPRRRDLGTVHFSLAGQQANSLLSDGHAWQDFERITLAATRRAMRAAEQARAALLVHASFAFVHAVEAGQPLDDPLRAHAETILECERRVLAGPVPACVVRLGYLYGPGSADLRAYRKAFRLGRPYWSGPPRTLQYHLHCADAARALLAAARPRNAGKRCYATDGHPLPFRTFMDAFAHRVGRARPLHLPAIAKPFARVIIREEHMQQTAFGMPRRAPGPSVPGWTPRYADYRAGLDEVVAAWGQEADTRTG